VWGRGRGMGRGRMRRRRMRCRRGRGWLGFQFPSIRFPTIGFPKIRKVEDEKVQQIYDLLPKRDCGACGYESCYECAQAIASGEAPPDACRVAGKRIAPLIERILRG